MLNTTSKTSSFQKGRKQDLKKVDLDKEECIKVMPPVT